MSQLANLRVLIFQQRGWGLNVGHPLAKRLQAEGCRLAALTIKHNTHLFTTTQTEVTYEHIFNADKVKENPEEFLGDYDVSLTEICKELGIDSIWPLVQTMRNHVKTYADKYYYGFRQNIDDDGIIAYVKAIFKNIRTIFDTFDPEIIVVPNHAGLQHIIFNLFARKRGVRTLALTDSKIGGLFYFDMGYLMDDGPMHDRYEELCRGEKSPNEAKAKEFIKGFRQRLVKSVVSRTPAKKLDFKARVLKEVMPFIQCIQYYRTDKSRRHSNLGVTIDYKNPRVFLRDHFMPKYYKWRTCNMQYYPFEKLDKFIFFPLQFQPEASIDVHAPFFNNQLETARQVAMSMPGDYTLCVKEHPAMVGKRPPSYLEKVARTPNVKLIDHRTPSYDIMKRAAMLVAPSGTILSEAAMMHVPAIQLGGLGKTACLPNVHKHTDMSTLAAKIKEVLAMDLNSEEYEQQLVNYYAANYDVGLEVPYYAIWEQGKPEGTDRLVDFYVQEIRRVTR